MARLADIVHVKIKTKKMIFRFILSASFFQNRDLENNIIIPLADVCNTYK